jgi:DHA1 family bicyclomycin/chloramphenicol resistance-like MFS transporter
MAARLVMRLGIDRTLGLGSVTLAVGGLGTVIALALGFGSAVSLVLPVAIYLAGLGMVLPQAIAGAMTPFPERAGAASALLGFIQQSAAALCGAVVGWFLGQNAWPLALAVAAMGCVTLIIWVSTRALRARSV